MKPKPTPSAEVLHGLFEYDKITGVLLWRKGIGRRRCGGNPAGTPREKLAGGPIYIYVAIDKVNYPIQRLIWKMMTGEDAVERIDHRDTDTWNNRWANLREATNGQNIQNSRLRKDNKSGVKGLVWEEDRKKWRATISADKKVHIKRFVCRDDAVAHLQKLRPDLHGEFAREV